MTAADSIQPLPRAGLGMALAVSIGTIVLYAGIGFALRGLVGNAAVAGYEVSWSIFASAIVGMSILYWSSREPQGLQALGLARPKRWSTAILFGFLGLIGVYALVVIIISVLISIGLMAAPEPSEVGIVSGPNPAISLTATLILMWINAAFFEELIFRGFILQKCANAIGKGIVSGIIGAAISAGLFGLLHYPSQGLTGVVITGVTGFFLGILFLLTKRNLTSVVITHGLINTVSIVASYASQA